MGTTSNTYGNLGPYELRELLGEGAMARVWRAWDPHLEREVAIKEPKLDPNASPEVTTELNHRFVNEAKAAARMNHGNIVTIYSADVYEGRPAIVMELVDGITLRMLLDNVHRLEPAQVLTVADQLLDAVAYAHAEGIVHRDIKPENIFIDGTGTTVKLADFGIAHIDDSSATHATIAGTVLGTVGYMSPEQVRGMAVDARSDLFSVGVVLYEMLTGKNPFVSSDDASNITSIMYRTVHEPAPELPEAASIGLPADLRPAIMAALAKDPADRPQSATEFKAMLHGAPVPQREGVDIYDPYPIFPQEPPKHTPQSPLPYLITAVVGIVVVLGLAFFASRPSAGTVTQDGASKGMTSEASYYLANENGYVAIWQTGATEPYDITDVRVSDLSKKQRTNLAKYPSFATLEEAEAKIKKYRASITRRAERAAEKERLAQAQTPPVFTQVSASSHLPWSSSDPDYHYEPEMAVDNNFETAWNEGATGDGTGEWIMLSAPSNQLVRGVKIVNGFSKRTARHDLFTYNNRPLQLRAEFSDGTSETILLNDYGYSWQSITFQQEHVTTSVKFVITSVKTGTAVSEGYHDACISEIACF